MDQKIGIVIEKAGESRSKLSNKSNYQINGESSMSGPYLFGFTRGPIVKITALIHILIFALVLHSGVAFGGLIGDRPELEAILSDSLVLEDFESVVLNFPTPPLTPEIWIGAVLDSGSGVVDGLVFTREPPGSLTVQDPLLLGGNQVLITNSGAIAIDFSAPTPAFGFDFDRPTNTQTLVILNVFAEDDVTLLATETISLFFDGFIGFSELSGIGKATVSSYSVTIPSSTSSRIDNVTFGAVSAVPVPAIGWLLGPSLLGLVAMGRRKKAQETTTHS